MPARAPRFTLLVVVAAALGLSDLLVATASAQYYRFGRRRAVVVTPGVGVRVSPYGVRVSSPYGRFNYGGAYYGFGRYGYSYRGGVVTTPGVTVQTTPRSTSVGVSVGKPVVESPADDYALQGGPTLAGPVVDSPVVAPSTAGLSEADLAAMQPAALMAALANASAALQAELGGLQGGDGWQRYLATPKGVGLGQADAEQLNKLLTRFDSVARAREFAVIASLPSFERVRVALRVAVDQGATPAIDPPTLGGDSAEALPSPATPDGDEVTERSVLAR